jgi:hypothetical protein
MMTNDVVSHKCRRVRLSETTPNFANNGRALSHGCELAPDFTSASDFAANGLAVIEFVGLSRKSLRYQYKLEGASSHWSEPSDRRFLDFAHLSSGAVRHVNRAVA